MCVPMGGVQIPHEIPKFDGDCVQMKGFPISAGVIQAKARVVNKLADAHTIQVRLYETMFYMDMRFVHDDLRRMRTSWVIPVCNASSEVYFTHNFWFHKKVSSTYRIDIM